MKKFKESVMLIIMSLLVFSACGGGGGGSDDPGDNPGDDPKKPGAYLEINGDTYTYTLPGGIKLNAILTPLISTDNLFPCNIDANDNLDEETDVANVPTRFIIGETEVTYELCYEVYKWATINGYTFANAGREGNDGTDGAEPTEAKQEPVTYINWRDIIVWCNALTEFYNANNGLEADLDVVYCSDADFHNPIRSSADGIYGKTENSTEGSFDKPYVNSSSKGFRLPSSIEWEFAARYRGTDSTNAIAGSDGSYYTKGNSASGDTQMYDVAVPTIGDYAVYNANSGNSTAVVKSKAKNSLGLYDMSGNVYEWCFDLHQKYENSFRVFRGGAYRDSVVYLRLANVSNYASAPYSESVAFGFRLCRNK